MLYSDIALHILKPLISATEVLFIASPSIAFSPSELNIPKLIPLKLVNQPH